MDEFGRLDVLMSNGGIGKTGSHDRTRRRRGPAVIDVNLREVFHGIAAALRCAVGRGEATS